MFEWGWGVQPDEWIDEDWFDKDGNYHTISELGGMRKEEKVASEDTEDIPF